MVVHFEPPSATEVPQFAAVHEPVHEQGVTVYLQSGMAPVATETSVRRATNVSIRPNEGREGSCFVQEGEQESAGS